MTLDEIVYEVRMRVRQLNLYDDDKLDDRLMKHWVHNQRALWIRNELNKNRTIDEQIIQTLPAECLVIADRSECPNAVTGYSVLQTGSDIPKTIEVNNADGIIEVGPVDRIARPFCFVNVYHARWCGNGRWNRNMICAFRWGNRIMLVSKDMQSGSFLKYLRYLRVRGVFENPEDVAEHKHLDGTACYNTATDDYPMNRWMWNYIRDQITKDNFQLITSAPTDKVNDASETLKVSANEDN